MENHVFNEVRNNLNAIDIDYKSNLKGNKLIFNYFEKDLLLVKDNDKNQPFKIFIAEQKLNNNVELLSITSKHNLFITDNYIDVSTVYYEMLKDNNELNLNSQHSKILNLLFKC